MKPKQRLFFMLPFLAIAAYLAFVADKEPVSAIAEPVRTVSAAAEVAREPLPRASGDADQIAGMLRLQSRAAIQTERGRSELANVFDVIKQNAGQVAAAQEQGPGTPSFNYQYIGRELSQGRWKIFFEHDGEAVIARQNANLGDFRLSKIDAKSITVTHLPSGTQQVIVTESEQ